MAEGTSIMHINLVIVLEMHDKVWNITSYTTFTSSVRAVVRPVFTILLMFKLAVIWEHVNAT